LLADRYEDKVESTIVEERIYSGFPSNDDQALMHSFHEENWEDRLGVIQEIKDDRYRQLGQRIIATERSDLLTDIQRQRWDSWCRERHYPEGETPWLTVHRALVELSDLTKRVSPDQKRQLADVQHFLEALEN
jgi:exonuclease I